MSGMPSPSTSNTPADSKRSAASRTFRNCSGMVWSASLEQADVIAGDSEVFQRFRGEAGGGGFTADGLEEIGGLIAHRVNPRELRLGELRCRSSTGVLEDLHLPGPVAS